MSWEAPDLPVLPGHGVVPAVVDSAKGRVQLSPGPVAGVYVCGITPYDATHLGHAATYVTFDILIRALRDAGHQVRYVQNVTDVDDPLLERAVRDGLDWRELAERETQLFREDMRALRVLPPEHYIGVVESLAVIEAQVGELVDSGAAYALPIPPADPATARSADGGADFYLDLTRRPDFGDASGWTRAQMDAVFAERGGDPDRPGKRDPLDPLLWRAARPGEPSWPSDRLGAGRPGWHIECTSIALEYLGMGFEVQGGGVDLVFPHHEMSAVQASALRGDEEPFAKAFVHQAMVGYEGHKMSKSLGNLVLVSRLRAQGVDPMAIRLVLLGHHHGTDWEYLPAMLDDATARLGLWREAVRRADPPPAAPVLAAVRAALADDLDTPGALAAIDAWALSREPGCQSSGDPSTGDPSAGRPSTGDPGVGAGSSEGHLVARLADALLGVRLDAGSD